MNSTPMLNVNLKPCRCQEPKKRAAPCEPGRHRPECGGPVLIPYPLPPTVTLQVALGECIRDPFGCKGARHATLCPLSYPVSVTCTIGGETWEGSEVVGVEWAPRADWQVEFERPDQSLIESACRARWALVKALVLGYTAWDYTMSGAAAVPLATITELLSWRDSVFAALAELARTEEAHEAKRLALPEPIRPRSVYGNQRPSEEGLARYVTALLNTVGALS